MAASTQRQDLDVEVTRVRFRDQAADFAVLSAVTDQGEELTLVGPVAHLHQGASARVRGVWQTHPEHGRQLRCESVRVAPPTSAEAVAAYLAQIRHIGPQAARWLVAEHGPEAVLGVIDSDPGRAIGAVPGIGRRKLPEAVRSWDEHRSARAVRLFLEEHGVPASSAGRIQRAFADGSIERLRSDPYAITSLDGIGFATADSLASALGVAPDAPRRIDAGLLHALELAESDGHCNLPADALARSAAELLGAPQGTVAGRRDELVRQGDLIRDGDAIVEPAMDRCERELAQAVARLSRQRPAPDMEVPAEPPSGPGEPTPDQWRAIQAVAAHRLSILTGLPGTGKTATLRALVAIARSQGLVVRLCAPTGKAARRLAEATGAEATTIHRLLEYVPGAGFARDADDPITGDILIADEASMLDVRLARSLLCAVGPGTRVLLVGDVDQLAPVGPGRVLDDLIGAGTIPVTRLERIFRQASRSLIIRAAHAINRGEVPQHAVEPGAVRDFFLIERHGAEAIFAEAVSLASGRLARHYGLDPLGDVQVLAPVHRGPAGIEALNRALADRLNPSGRALAGLPFRIGDRVVQSRNDHDAMLMNGQTAVVLAQDGSAGKLVLSVDDGRTLRLSPTAAATLRPAYAMSIHKAQGSQAPAIVVVLHTGHRVMLTRSLLYTAVTRAERVCVVVGEPRAIALAVERLDARRRNTRLASMIAGGWEDGG